MKKTLLLAALGLVGMANATADETRAIAWTAPEFVEAEWTYIGEGTYTPGVFDYFDEITYALTTKVWESNTKPGDYWVEAQMSEEMNVEEGEFGFPGPFIVHASNRDKVYTDPIWTIHPLIFCMFPMVPEIMGVGGSESAYGQMDEDGYITFPAGNYTCQTMPTGSPTSNIAGEFSVIIPMGGPQDDPNKEDPNDEPNKEDPNDEPNNEDPENGGSGVSTLGADAEVAQYFTMQGVRVAAPVKGSMYIVRRGGKSVKVVY